MSNITQQEADAINNRLKKHVAQINKGIANSDKLCKKIHEWYSAFKLFPEAGALTVLEECVDELEARNEISELACALCNKELTTRLEPTAYYYGNIGGKTYCVDCARQVRRKKCIICGVYLDINFNIIRGAIQEAMTQIDFAKEMIKKTKGGQKPTISKSLTSIKKSINTIAKECQSNINKER